jgi:hypothetical protein
LQARDEEIATNQATVVFRASGGRGIHGGDGCIRQGHGCQVTVSRESNDDLQPKASVAANTCHSAWKIGSDSLSMKFAGGAALISTENQRHASTSAIHWCPAASLS